VPKRRSLGRQSRPWLGCVFVGPPPPHNTHLPPPKPQHQNPPQPPPAPNPRPNPPPRKKTQSPNKQTRYKILKTGSYKGRRLSVLNSHFRGDLWYRVFLTEGGITTAARVILKSDPIREGRGVFETTKKRQGLGRKTGVIPLITNAIICTSWKS